jgi:hypothetical protein
MGGGVDECFPTVGVHSVGISVKCASSAIKARRIQAAAQIGLCNALGSGTDTCDQANILPLPCARAVCAPPLVYSGPTKNATYTLGLFENKVN